MNIHTCVIRQNGRWFDVVCQLCGVVASGVRRPLSVEIKAAHERAYDDDPGDD